MTSSTCLSSVDTAKKHVKNETRLEHKILKRKLVCSIHIPTKLQRKICSKDIIRIATCVIILTALLFNSMSLFNHLQCITYFISPYSLVDSETQGFFHHPSPNQSLWKSSSVFSSLSSSSHLSALSWTTAPGSFILSCPTLVTCGKLKASFFTNSFTKCVAGPPW